MGTTPGMVKRQCPQCRYWFAASPHSNGAVQTAQHRTAQREDRYDGRAKPVTILARRQGEQQRETPLRHKEAAAQRVRQAHAGRQFVARTIEILARGNWLPRLRRHEAAMPI